MASAPMLHYNKDDFPFPVSKAQWHHCIEIITQIYLIHQSFLPMIKHVYSLHITEREWERGYHDHHDFSMKLRRVFYWWSHHTQASRQQTSPVAAPSFANFDVGWTDRFYCFCTAVRRVFFEHGYRAGSGNRRRPMCAGFSKKLLDALFGPDDDRRTEWFEKFNAIHSRRMQFIDKKRGVMPPEHVEAAALIITGVIYWRIKTVTDMLELKAVQDETGKRWTDAMIDDIMKEVQVVQLERWLQQNGEDAADSTSNNESPHVEASAGRREWSYYTQKHGKEKLVVEDEVEENGGAQPLLCTKVVESSFDERIGEKVMVHKGASCLSNILTTPVVPLCLTQEEQKKRENNRRGTRATRQLIRSTINLRMKQVLKADPDLSTQKRIQSFRATIAVLGGDDGTAEIKIEGKKIKRTKKRKRNNSKKDTTGSKNKKNKTDTTGSKSKKTSKKKNSSFIKFFLF